MGALLSSLFSITTAAAEDRPSPTPVAEPGDPSLVRLEALVRQLGSTDAEERRAAFDALTSLDEATLPAARARIERLRRHRPPREWAQDILNRFRRRASADEVPNPDPADGVLAELAERHAASERAMVVAMAEPLLLWRALDRIGTFEAQRAVFPMFGLDDGLFMPEARNWVRRRGNDLMAAAIVGRAADDRYVRRWGSWAMRHLGADDPGRAVHNLDEDHLPDVLRAYAGLRMQSAMQVIISYVDSERRRVRRAARSALEIYGGNAIWILRTAYHRELGEHAPEQWGWRRLSQELYEHVDAQRLAPVRAALEEGLAAAARGDFETMRARFDDVLARVPELEDRDSIATGYAALAEQRLGEGDLRDARWAYRRALRLAPESSSRRTWQAQLSFIEAEANRRRGIWDEDAYERVLAQEPNHTATLEVLATAAPSTVSATSTNRRSRTGWGLIAAAMLGLVGAALLWRGFDGGRAEQRAEERAELGPTCETTLEAEQFQDAGAAGATLADQTLPG